MKLYLNDTSPFARLARVVAIEKGLTSDLELHWVDPWRDDAALLAVTPLARVPTLVADDGAVLTESLLIARFLDDSGNGPPLATGIDVTTTLALAGLGHGLTDAAFQHVIARKHGGPDADRSTLGQRRERAIRRTLDTLAGWPDAGAPGIERPHLGDLVVGVGLAYLDFRLPELGPTPGKLTRWQALAERESFAATAFPTG